MAREPRVGPPYIDAEVETDILHQKVDAIISDTRGAKLWRKQTDEKLEGLDRRLAELTDGQGRLEMSMFELLSIAKRAEERASGAKVEAATAVATAKMVANQASRASWTDEVAHEAARVGIQKVTQENNEVIESRRLKTVRRNRIILGAVALLYTTIIPAFVTLLLHGCQK